MKKHVSTLLSIGQCMMILEEETTIESSDLADFLFLFRGAYAAGIPSVEKMRAAGNEPDPNTLADKIRKHLAKLTVSQINDLFQQDLGPNRLLTERISRDSPFEIVLSGTIILLVLAVILSGGSFELGPGGVKAHLSPMGKGIKHLREALTRKTRVLVGYGVKSRTIKLNKGELAELSRQDPETKDSGGFQSFLVRWQMTVNRNTGELVLSKEDMDRIIRLGKNRSKGGFQGRIYKIFQRHFDFNKED
ncbi:MAG: hypothetical protein ACLQPD_12395 [Desulfomonilaceae bacterium]